MTSYCKTCGLECSCDSQVSIYKELKSMTQWRWLTCVCIGYQKKLWIWWYKQAGHGSSGFDSLDALDSFHYGWLHTENPYDRLTSDVQKSTGKKYERSRICNYASGGIFYGCSHALDNTLRCDLVVVDSCSLWWIRRSVTASNRLNRNLKVLVCRINKEKYE